MDQPNCWKFAFSKKLLAWDYFLGHMTEDVKICLKEIKTESVVVRESCTKYIQAPDFVWNKISNKELQGYMINV